ncbi:MAG: hypothetical protein GF330_14820, partial [Candidatus Eisenbacteria bacterium]|nr:hypothetical protein [Candidatus Eisenbacteria bacterium]
MRGSDSTHGDCWLLLRSGRRTGGPRSASLRTSRRAQRSSLLLILGVALFCACATAPPEIPTPPGALPALRPPGAAPLRFPAPLPSEAWASAALELAERPQLTRPFAASEALWPGEGAAARRDARYRAAFDAGGAIASLRRLTRHGLDRGARVAAQIDLAEQLLRDGAAQAAADALEEAVRATGEGEIAWRLRLWRGAALAEAGDDARAAAILTQAAAGVP